MRLQTPAGRFFAPHHRAPPTAPGCPAEFRTAGRWRCAWLPSTPPRKQRRGRQRPQPKQQLTQHLGRAAPPPPAPAITLLQQAVDPLRRAALLEPPRRRRGQRQLSPPRGCGSRRGTGPRLRPKAWLCGVAYAVHQVVARGHALRRELRQRDGHLRSLHAGAGQHRAARAVPVPGVPVPLVAEPACRVGLALSQPQSCRRRGRGGRASGRRGGGGERIATLGDESVGQSSARRGWSPIAAPVVAAGQAAEVGAGDATAGPRRSGATVRRPGRGQAGVGGGARSSSGPA